MVKVAIEKKSLREPEKLINLKLKHQQKEEKMKLKSNMKWKKRFLMVKVDLRNNW